MSNLRKRLATLRSRLEDELGIDTDARLSDDEVAAIFREATGDAADDRND